MTQENIAIENLARMVKKEFGQTAKKDEVNERFDGAENRLGRIEMKELKDLLAIK